MIRPVTFSAIVVSAVFLVVVDSRAACLLDDYSVEAEFARSEIVALVSVSSEREVAEDTSSDALDGTLYGLRIQEVFRGRAQGTVVVFSENSSGRFPMQKGNTYIVFLYLQEGLFSIDNCGNSGVASEKQAVIAKVRTLAKK